MTEVPHRRDDERISEYTILLPPRTLLYDDDPVRNPRAQSFVTVGGVDFRYLRSGYGMTHLPGHVIATHHPQEQTIFSDPQREWYLEITVLNGLKKARRVEKRAVDTTPAPDWPTPPHSDKHVQGAFTSILGAAPVDETHYLRPDGKRRRR
ncbi:MAG: hypothetical protein UZ21_OP11001000489 [Microgenomates bacterium OLB22]|nr:MAG: hypothetical protein UZ21_OP11001000489 [Microgenomates bacterium OLB22]